MGDEIEIVNLFGELALESTVLSISDKVTDQTAIINAMKTIMSAINDKTLLINTDNIKGDVGITSFPLGKEPLTDEELRASKVPVDVTFPSSQRIYADSLPLPVEASKDSTSEAIRVITAAIKTMVESNNAILTALNSKIEHIDTNNVTILNYLGLTDDELRATPLPVEVDFPASQPVTMSGVSTELTLNSLKVINDDIKTLTSAIKDLITTNRDSLVALNAKTVKQDSDNVIASLGDLRSIAALRAIGRQQYDSTNRLMVANTGSTSVSGTVTVAGTVGVSLLGNSNAQALTNILTRLNFYKTLERFDLTK